MTRAAEIRSAHVTVSRGRIEYLDAGSGTPVLLLHGWPGFSRDWQELLHLAGKAARLIAPDFLGFGGSSALPTSDIEAADEEALARDMLELLDRLEIESGIIAGYDVGSAVGPAIARLAPERVRGLLLLNPTHPLIGEKAASPEMISESWYQHFHTLPLSSELLDGKPEALRAYLGHFYEHWGGERKISAEHFEETIRVYSQPGAFTSSVRWYSARIARRRRPAVKTPPLQMKTIALWGDRDPMRPLSHREGFEISFPNSESRVLEGVGHFLPFEAPDAVAGAIGELVDQLD